jgi:hypothetical protein
MTQQVVISGGAQARIIAQQGDAATVRAERRAVIYKADAIPVPGPKGEPGARGAGADEIDIVDLTLIFENRII